jgi:hypothetical protein
MGAIPLQKKKQQAITMPSIDNNASSISPFHAKARNYDVSIVFGALE